MTIINYHLATDQSGVQAQLASHTCPLDGYVYAWADPTNPLLVWELETCPADAVITALQVNIGNFVNVHVNYTNTITDVHQRVLAIIDKAREDAVNWLNLYTSPEIAGFISSQTAQLQGYILDALNTQGVIGQEFD
jgi:hypothetical protein